ncbi:MAG TPA: acetolactate decarboxylase [Kiritimatiellia bacterium]|nr:acetolactate decarboxylase [Kiritimatiellia bacterium]HMO98434.1 acetolactate decarboxylase [Kiritimatiellia bacterium]HMP95852.1 acetolactate decarboxylase [Kiritimatiellia bacterium]
MNDGRYCMLFRMVVLAGLAVIAGCRSPLLPRQEYDDTVTHAGIIADLAGGRYEGFYAVSNLFRYGNHGLGTFDRLDGEMIIHSGRVYRADVDGMLSAADPAVLTPFAVVTFFTPDRIFDIEQVGMERFHRAMDIRRTADLPEALEVNGRFSSITLRSVPAQDEPYVPLAQVLERDQRMQTHTNLHGTMVGYYFPAELSALHPAGYHWHFIDAERKTGGHVLDFTVQQARIAVDISPKVQVLLPETRPYRAVMIPVRPPGVGRTPRVSAPPVAD